MRLPKQALKAEVSGLKKWLKCPWLPPLLYCLLSSCLDLWTRRRGGGWFPRVNQQQQHLVYRWSCDMQAPPTRGRRPSRTWLRAVLPVGRALGSALVLHFAWKEKRPDEWLQLDSWAQCSGLAGWLGTQNQHDWKIGDKGIWGRGMWIGNKPVSIHVPHECSLKGALSRFPWQSAQDDLPVDSSQPLSRPPCHRAEG